ncbi:endochitinase At2g43590 [Arabidopsis lyrata subsp. lyrata]|nr:endochitinase At2g43590 [Arabidopsis lyrata subsp. lyrata]|eukprot:XP_020882332.1 endochitinase At2g43590 [Arabidopsis lyrata subsp. lyrata]
MPMPICISITHSLFFFTHKQQNMAFTKIVSVIFLCLLGPCIGVGTTSSGGSVSSIVTQGFFNNIINQAGNGCTRKRLYTRDSFIDAANSFPNFASSVTRREIATMFAHVTHETGHFCYIEETKKKSRGRCDENVEQKPCPSPRKGHSGRGQSLGLDLLSQPELVGSNPTVAFTKGLSFWINSVRPVLNQGFGATIRAINGMECNGGNSGAVNARIGYYRDYCRQLGVDPGPNLSC